jgi:hypothetical protein
VSVRGPTLPHLPFAREIDSFAFSPSLSRGTEGSNPAPSKQRVCLSCDFIFVVKNPGFPRGFLAGFTARSAESRSARQHRAKQGQYLCPAIFQYRISGDAVTTSRCL